MLKISVAICTYNGEKYIQEQLNSILNQEKPIDEIVICDDGSTDNTMSICQSVLSNTNIKYILKKNEQNLGFIKNFYQAMSLCSGDIIFLCDQDDVWFKNKTNLISHVFEENENAQLVFSNALVTNEKLETINELFNTLNFSTSYFENQEKAFKKLLNDNFVVGATAAIRKDFLNKVSDFDNGWAHDSWLAIIATLYNGLFFIDEPLIYYRQHSSNTIGLNQENKLNKVKTTLKKFFINNQDKYAGVRLPLLLYLKDYMLKKDFNKENYLQLDKCIEFWNRRSKFSKNTVFKNVYIVLKDAIKGEQKRNRNITKPVIIDLINAILIAKK